jgi:hypothetical protein
MFWEIVFHLQEFGASVVERWKQQHREILFLALEFGASDKCRKQHCWEHIFLDVEKIKVSVEWQKQWEHLDEVLMVLMSQEVPLLVICCMSKCTRQLTTRGYVEYTR